MKPLPPDLVNQGIEGNEECRDNILNEECSPDKVFGEVEIQREASKDEIAEKESRHSAWRKSDEVSLCNARELQKSDEAMTHKGESM